MIKSLTLLLLAGLAACTPNAALPDERDGKAKVPSTPVVDKSNLDFAAIRRIPVQDSLRYPPFGTYAKVRVRRVTGKSDFNKTDPVVTFLHWRFDPESAAHGRFLKLPSIETAERYGLELPTPKTTHTSLALVSEAEAFFGAIPVIRKKKFTDKRKTEVHEDEILAFFGRVSALSRICGVHPRDLDREPHSLAGEFPLIPPVSDPTLTFEYVFGSPADLDTMGWDAARSQPIEAAMTDLRRSWDEDDGAGFTHASEALLAGLLALKPDRDEHWRGLAWADREVAMNAWRPFFWLRFGYFGVFFLALIALPFGNRFLWGLSVAAALATLGFHVYWLLERTAIADRAMIGNLYESAIFVAAAAMLVALIFELIWRRAWLVVAGSFVAMLMLFWSQSNPEFWNPEVSKLQPVLINNSLIHIHVPLIMTSYAVLALTVILAHVYLIMWWARGASKDPEHVASLRRMATFMFWTIPVGVILLIGGIVLGGVWADASWGRFWGNDPKEVAAAVTWVCFVIVIHGRWAGWLKDTGTALASMVGGLALLWTYWGANYIQKGMHSYAGSGADIPVWPIYYGGIEVLFFVGTLIVFKLRQLHYQKFPDAEPKASTPPDGLMTIAD